jgi:hypothetical protein
MPEIELLGGPKDGERWQIVHDLMVVEFVTKMEAGDDAQAPVVPGTIVTATMYYKRTERRTPDHRRIYEFDGIDPTPYAY